MSAEDRASAEEVQVPEDMELKPEDTPRTRRRKEDFLVWAQRRHKARLRACSGVGEATLPAIEEQEDADSAVLKMTDGQVCRMILGMQGMETPAYQLGAGGEGHAERQQRLLAEKSPGRTVVASAPPATTDAPAADNGEATDSSSSFMTLEVLNRQDDLTSNGVLKALAKDQNFKALATSEGNDLIHRDREDESKLAKGIEISVAKGVLKANPEVAPIKQIDVAGKSADQVATELLDELPGKDGNVIILQGLSGTGKGTTVGKLTKALSNCVTWSNGNVFRTFTLLASKHCEEQGIEFTSSVLTAELLQSFVSRVAFVKFEGEGFDVVIDGNVRVSTIANTELKKPEISARVPTVAEQTQGEVVKFAAGAIEQLTEAGHNVIIEGRAQTLQYIPSPSRFELVIADTALLGSRRAAQRVMAAAAKILEGENSGGEISTSDVQFALEQAAASMVVPTAADDNRKKEAAPVSPGGSTMTTVDSKPTSLRILHFNDVYNVWAAERGDVCGGAARFQNLIDSYFPGGSRHKAGEPAPLVFFSGDLFAPSVASTVTLGAHMPQVINRMRVACSVYGNHDMDFGIEQLETLRDQCNFPWLISNVKDKKTGKPLAGGEVTVMLTHEHRKIGVVGLVEQAWMATLATVNQEDIDFEDPTACARRLSAELREQGAEIVVALTHMRVPNDMKLAEEAGDVLDVILGGHDHHYEVQEVEPHGIHVVKSGTDFRDMTVLDLDFSSPDQKKKPFSARYEHVQVTRDMPENEGLVAVLKELEDEIQSNMKKPIGRLTVDLDVRFKAIRTSETNASNFVADCVRGGILPHPDVVLINSGTLRTDAVVPNGEYTVGDLMAMLPMMDPLIVLKLSGKQLIAALENGVSQWPALEGRFPCVSGVAFSFDTEKPAGERVIRDSVKVGGQLLCRTEARLVQDDEFYTLCTKEYLVTGKDGYTMFPEAEVVCDSEDLPMLSIAVRHNFLIRSVVDKIRMLEGHTARGAARRLHDQLRKKHGEEPPSSPTSPLSAADVSITKEGRIVQVNGAMVCE